MIDHFTHTIRTKGFTLIETLVALTLLTTAIIPPISLTVQSLSTAYYARDQITAYYLAQEAIEVVRDVRDANVLKAALGQTGVNLLDNIPNTTGRPFVVDSLQNTMSVCQDNTNGNLCPPLQTDSTQTVYGYNPSCTISTTGDCGTGSGWIDSRFTRYVKAVQVSDGGTGIPQEIRVSVTVSWKYGQMQVPRSFTISEDIYRWVKDNSAT